MTSEQSNVQFGTNSIRNYNDDIIKYPNYSSDMYRSFWKTNEQKLKLRIHNITTKGALKFGSEVWVLKKRTEQRLEAAHMTFLRHLFGITKLDKGKNKCIRGEKKLGHRT